MASQGSGNTKCRAFLITLNEVEKYNNLKQYLLSLKTLDYLLSAEELAPTTGHCHIHIYCHFKNMIKLSLKKMCGAHIDGCRGTPKQCIEYVKKDGKIIDEIGDEPHQGRALTIKELKETKDAEQLPDWHQYNIWSKLQTIENNNIDVDDWSKTVKVYYIQGPSGCGKTEKAKSIVRDNIEKYGKSINIVKYENNFWVGTGTANIAIYDDFRSSHMKASEFINFIDYNKHSMNIKGGSIQNNYQLIIITSVESITEIYRNMTGEPRQQWIRRVEVIDMYETNNIDVDSWL